MIRKTVYFSAEEKELFEHFESKNRAFGTYVKELIIEDMNKESLDSIIQGKLESHFTSNFKENFESCFKECFEVCLKEYLSKHDLISKENDSKFTEEDREDLKSFMK